ncbi:YojF family protein [Bacillus luteolus]|uniref:YojF family protein n=1 Tax=Litchfieldia luteola TaxID=682179 RepID=A0ABR9QNB6_9BACI|nr:YojF family protein [Cytobacillus luteolus]MBE4910001.1 YojF family protein [Cytobacillus luteolus]
MALKAIDVYEVQATLNGLVNQELYIHLETTKGAYAAHNDDSQVAVGAYIRNAKVIYNHGKITGDGPYRVGLKMDLGWIYAEGVTDWEFDDKGRLLLTGHDSEGRLTVSLQLSPNPF